MVSRLLLGIRPEPRVAVVVRVLGARHLLQALVIGQSPSSPVLHTGGAVADSLHSASMVLLGSADPRRRKPAAIDALLAGLFAAAEFRAAGRASETR
jgi:hypothetical protein